MQCAPPAITGTPPLSTCQGGLDSAMRGARDRPARTGRIASDSACHRQQGTNRLCHTYRSGHSTSCSASSEGTVCRELVVGACAAQIFEQSCIARAHRCKERRVPAFGGGQLHSLSSPHSCGQEPTHSMQAATAVASIHCETGAQWFLTDVSVHPSSRSPFSDALVRHHERCSKLEPLSSAHWCGLPPNVARRLISYNAALWP